MANMSLTTSLVKSTKIVSRSFWSSKVCAGTAPRIIQASKRDAATITYDGAAEAAKQGAKEAMKVGAKIQATSVAEDVAGKAKTATGRGLNTAKDLSGRAQENVKEAWNSAKDTTNKIKETVVGKVEEAKESINRNV